MFIGHYSAALAAKAVEPRAPLWAYVAGAQLVDIGWASLVMANVEHVRIDESLPGSALDLYDMPYTHSLPAALAWAFGAALIARFVLRLPWRAGVAVGAVVFSHWLLDFLVHRPDLELWMGGPKVGLALWNMPLAEMALEMGLIAIAGALWVAQRKGAGNAAQPAIWFITLLVAVQVYAAWPGRAPPDTFSLAATALAIYIVMAVAAAFSDRGVKP